MQNLSTAYKSVQNFRQNLPGGYRYGFQGQEEDDVIKGEGNSVNYKFRMHDPRIGRFFAVDPLSPKYPELTPYQFSSNRVIDGAELEGLEYCKAPDCNQGFNATYYANMLTELDPLIQKAGASTISSLAFSITYMYSGIVTGTTYAFGETVYGSGFRTVYEPTVYKFDQNGWYAYDVDHYGDVTFEDGKELMGTIVTVITAPVDLPATVVPDMATTGAVPIDNTPSITTASSTSTTTTTNSTTISPITNPGTTQTGYEFTFSGVKGLVSKYTVEGGESSYLWETTDKNMRIIYTPISAEMYN